CVCALVGIVGVYYERFRQFACSTGESAQYEHASFIVARCNELLRYEIHAIVQTAHETDLRCAIVLINADRFVMLDAQNDWRWSVRRKSRVDFFGGFSNACLVVFVFLDVRSRRSGNLHERKLADPVRMQVEQTLYGAKTLLNALGIVEPLDTNAQRMILRKRI